MNRTGLLRQSLVLLCVCYLGVQQVEHANAISLRSFQGLQQQEQYPNHALTASTASSSLTKKFMRTFRGVPNDDTENEETTNNTPTTNVSLEVSSTKTLPASSNADAVHRDSSVLCRMTIEHTMKEGLFDRQITCIPVVDGEELDETFHVSLPDTFYQQYKKEIKLGTAFVSIMGAELVDDVLTIRRDANFTRLEPTDHMRRLQSRHLKLTGNLSIAVLRVSVQDSSPQFTAAQLRQGIFENNVSAPIQYRDCSRGQLQWVLSDWGVMEVYVDQPASNFADYGLLVTAVQKQIKAEGIIDAVKNMADRVIMCLPPGVGGSWFASASLNHWRAQFNDDWCLSLTGLMHEIGHTLGLVHSNEDGSDYGDVTGYMGSGSTAQTWPRKCFNGHKSWTLGWYRNRHLTLYPLDDKTTRLVSLAAFVDYDSTTDDHTVIVNIADTYFLLYNRAKSFNSETNEKADMVTVTEDVVDKSENRAGLSVGQSFRVMEFQGSKMTLVVDVCVNIEGTPDLMIISIGVDDTACGTVEMSEYIESVTSTVAPSENSTATDSNSTFVTTPSDESNASPPVSNVTAAKADETKTTTAVTFLTSNTTITTLLRFRVNKTLIEP